MSVDEVMNDLQYPRKEERRTDEWCTDCKEYDTERHCCPRFNRVIRAAMPRWIPVTEALPEPDVAVLWSCHFPGESEFFPERWYMKISHFEGLTNHGKPSVYDIGNDVEILAWMPLPEPYGADMRGTE